MLPTFRASQIVLASGWFTSISKDDIIIFEHLGLEKIKRVQRVDQHKGVFVAGDNPSQSTDSRSFGWIDFNQVSAKVFWPF